MELKRIRYFLEVSEAGSFSRAASKLHIAQSALSRQVAHLESELNVTLFERYDRGISLTEAGALFRTRAIDILGSVARLRVDIQSFAEHPAGDAAFGAPPSLRSMITLPVLSEYRRRYPRSHLTIAESTTYELREMLTTGVAELAVISSAESEASLIRMPLLTERMYLVAPSERKLDVDTEVQLTELHNLPLIQTRRPNSLRVILETAMAKRGLGLNICAETNTLLMVDLVSKGWGFTVLPYAAIHQDVRTNKISAAPIAGLYISWLIAHGRELPLSAGAKQLIFLVKDRAHQAVNQGEWKGAILNSSG